MQFIPSLIDPVQFGFAALVALAAGFVKGAVGFGMPMIMISGLGSFLAPELALAALIVPTGISNGWQALRGGVAAALRTIVQFRVFLVVMLIFVALSAQLVSVISQSVFFLVLGVPLTVFAATQLIGLRLRLRVEHRRKAEAIMGALAGATGGLSGVFAPPTVAYLTAINAAKTEQVRMQGVVYGAGAAVLFAAHLRTGVLNPQTLPLSLWLLAPALVGMGLGFWVQDRLDQDKFRHATLAVLIVAGLNLIRRGLLN